MRTKFLAFAATALMLASCSNDEVLTPQDDLKDTPITIASASVAELTTRVITEEGHLIGRMGEPVAMSVWVEGSGDNYNAKNIEWINDGGATTGTPTIPCCMRVKINKRFMLCILIARGLLKMGK